MQSQTDMENCVELKSQTTNLAITQTDWQLCNRFRQSHVAPSCSHVSHMHSTIRLSKVD